MQILSSPADIIELSAPTTGAIGLQWTSSWVEFSGPTIQDPILEMFNLNGTINLGAILTIVNAPVEGNTSQVKQISIFNPDSSNHQVTVYVNSIIELEITLKTLEQLYYEDAEGWYVLDANGGRRTVVVNDPPLPVPQPIERILLSGSTNGRPIAVAATASPGTTIHTAIASTTRFDEIHLWASNRTGAAATLTLQFGGTGTADELTNALSIPANSAAIKVIDGEVLNNSLLLRAFSGTANAINVTGYVNRIG